MTKSAYYKRAGSYSKSYNAMMAEREGRYPRTVAAQELGLSFRAFDAGCEKAGYKSHEWHHVGKFANKVYYYDTTELSNNPLFWVGATTRVNKDHTKSNLSRAIWRNLKERFTAQVNQQATWRYNICYSDTYIIDDKLSAHNTRKAIREIIRNRATSASNQSRYEATHVPGRLRRIILKTDGTIIDNRGRELKYSQVNWAIYTTVFDHANDSVMFINE